MLQSNTKRTKRAGSSNLLDALIADWERERPDVDTSGKGIIYAIYILERGFRRQSEKHLQDFGLRFSDYTVLACLRRSGPPFSLNPGDLVQILELTSGAVSQILHKLEDKKLVSRSRNTADSRQVTVKLTKKGKALVDEAFDRLTENENALLGELAEDERSHLQDCLWNLMKRLRIG